MSYKETSLVGDLFPIEARGLITRHTTACEAACETACGL